MVLKAGKSKSMVPTPGKSLVLHCDTEERKKSMQAWMEAEARGT
jgi:hypothetical protein